MTNPLAPPPQSINQDQFNRLMTVQEKEILLKQQELDLRKQTDSNNYNYAKATLQAQADNLNSQRQHSLSLSKYRYTFGIIISIILCALILFGFYLNKDQAVLELIKAIVLLGTGAFGGYSYCKSQSKDNPK